MAEDEYHIAAGPPANNPKKIADLEQYRKDLQGRNN